MDKPTHYDFRIDNWTQETLPAARLASYLKELAKLFGHENEVHFLKVRKGSAIPELFVEHTAAPKVEAQLRLVGSQNASLDANKAQQNINKMLREDNSSATLRVKGGAVIINFPGHKTPLTEEVVIHDQGEIDGIVIRVGGKDDSVPIWLQGEDGVVYKNCNTTRQIAKDLAVHLFEGPIRVAGLGKWRRNFERIWELENFDIKSWQPLSTQPLVEVVEQLRAVEGSKWNEIAEPQLELKKLRSE
jgi:hypothetical protein